jgi:hypothetical protein
LKFAGWGYISAGIMEGRSGDLASIDLGAFRATGLERDPYDYLVVPGFVRPAALPAIEADFPRIDRHGSYPAEALDPGPAFTALLDEIQGPEVAAAFADKFAVDLSGRPTMVTVRGRCHARDGRIHTDSPDKIITALIYLNRGWQSESGRLRVLRSATDLDDFAAEVPPDAGTLLAFRRSDRSFHGHHRFVGPRRSVQLNWVTGADVVARERARHRLSARLKRWLPGA